MFGTAHLHSQIISDEKQSPFIRIRAMPKSSRVFISYSHDSPEHQARVLRLATRLVTEGIDVRLDQWEEDPDGGWPFWTERQTADADFVVLVCTDIYRRRVERPEDEQGGAGVFWEANVIRSQLYSAKGRDRRFIPVFFGVGGQQAIPEILQGATCYQIDDPAGYIALYRRLTDQPEAQRPELGSLVVLPRNDLSTDKAKEAAQPQENESSLPGALAFRKLEPIACDDKQLKSLIGTTTTYIRFDNYRSEDMLLYWINYEGVRVYYTQIEAGRSYLQQTYVTHPWVVTKKNAVPGVEDCVAIFEPSSDPGVAEIK